MQLRKSFACFCWALSALNGAQAESAHASPPPANLSQEIASRPGLRAGLAVSGGCVGGAVIGTVVPIFGNLVGCALGGLTGWWFGRDKTATVNEKTPAASL